MLEGAFLLKDQFLIDTDKAQGWGLTLTSIAVFKTTNARYDLLCETEI